MQALLAELVTHVPVKQAAALVAEEDALPFPDLSFDRILLVHALEDHLCTGSAQGFGRTVVRAPLTEAEHGGACGNARRAAAYNRNHPRTCPDRCVVALSASCPIP